MTFEKKFFCKINSMLPVQSRLQKYSYFSFDPNHFYIPRRSVPMQGRIAIVTDAGRNAVDAGGALTNALACGRRSRVVLTPRRRRQVGERNFTDDGGNKARSPAIECTHLCCRSRRRLIPWWASVLQRVMLCRWKLDWDDLAIVAWKKGGVIA